MAEKLCELKKKGGGGAKYTETSLWTNPSPTSSYSGGDVTLSESVEQYKYIKIKCRVSSSNAGTFSTIYSVDDLNTFMANSVSSGCGHIAIYDSSNNRHSRGIQYKDSTTINIKVAYQDGTTTQNNANCIPIEILGLNELDHGKLVMDSGTFTIAGGVTDTITCGFRPKKIYIYNFESTSKMFVDIYDENLSSTYIIGAYRSSSSTNNCSSYAIGGGNNGVIQSITDTGFIFKGSNIFSTLYYVAIG